MKRYKNKLNNQSSNNRLLSQSFNQIFFSTFRNALRNFQLSCNIWQCLTKYPHMNCSSFRIIYIINIYMKTIALYNSDVNGSIVALWSVLAFEPPNSHHPQNTPSYNIAPNRFSVHKQFFTPPHSLLVIVRICH